MAEGIFEEKGKHDVIWHDYPSHPVGNPKEAFAPFFLDGFKYEMRAGQSLIDFGCKTARVTKEFLSKGLHVTLVDISPYFLDEEIRNIVQLYSGQVHFVQACLWKLPESLKSAYWIYCCGVLEHLPETQIDLVLEQIAKRMRFGGYFGIALKEEPHTDRIQTLKDKDWWQGKLLKHFSIASEDIFSDEQFFNCRVLSKEPLR